MSTKARVFCITQPTASSQQFDGYGVANNGYEASNAASGQVLGYRSYQPTVFEPFDNTPPSKIRGRRNADGEDDYTGDGYNDDFTWGGDGEDAELENPGFPTPLGEPFVLLLFAAVAAVVVAWQQKRRAKLKRDINY